MANLHNVSVNKSLANLLFCQTCIAVGQHLATMGERVRCPGSTGVLRDTPA